MNYKAAVKQVLLCLLISCLSFCSYSQNVNELYKYDQNLLPRWSSPENLNGKKGNGGKENGGAKGHPYDTIGAGSFKELLNIKDAGIINRIWITINDRSPEMLRSLKIEMYWDDEKKPAVSAPFGDFFGVGLGKTTTFENALFVNGEGRSFVCLIPMPFKKGARIVVTNESQKKLNNIFFDVDYSLLPWNSEMLYFHTFWQRDTATKLAKDFELLPWVNGKGRFLGVNIGVNGNPQYKKSWFGEGEVKIYLDGDKTYPTLNGTGTEDYIGTAWGQGKFITRYSGCTIASDSLLQWAFYRYHIPDPIFFSKDCKVVLQQIGGDATENVASFQAANAPLIPVTTDADHLFLQYDSAKALQLNKADLPKGWTNFYRQDDISATAYFYLNSPSSALPLLQSLDVRLYNLKSEKK